VRTSASGLIKGKRGHLRAVNPGYTSSTDLA
jgi:hypothetical protein